MDSASEKRALLQSLCPGTFCVFINVLSCWIVSVGNRMYGRLRKNDNMPYWTKGTSGRAWRVGMEREYVLKRKPMVPSSVKDEKQIREKV